MANTEAKIPFGQSTATTKVSVEDGIIVRTKLPSAEVMVNTTITYTLSSARIARLLDPVTQEVTLEETARILTTLKEKAPGSPFLLATKLLHGLGASKDLPVLQAATLILDKVFDVEKPDPDELKTVYLDTANQQGENADPTNVGALVVAGHIMIPYLPLEPATLTDFTDAFMPVVRTMQKTPEKQKVASAFYTLRENLRSKITSKLLNKEQAQIFHLLDNGRTRAYIRSVLRISPETLRNQLRRIREKGFAVESLTPTPAGTREDRTLELLKAHQTIDYIAADLGVHPNSVWRYIADLRASGIDVPSIERKEPEPFTPTEQSIIALLEENKKREQISEELGIKLPTLRSHFKNLRAKGYEVEKGPSRYS